MSTHHFPMLPPANRFIRALYIRGDPYETCDPVFGAKQSLVVDVSYVDDEIAEQYGASKRTWLLKHNFVLATDEEASVLRDRNASVVTTSSDVKIRLVNHLPTLEVELPVPELD